MKALRPFLLPAACFVVAWALSRFATRSTGGANLANSGSATPDLPTKVPRDRGPARGISAGKLAEQFRARPLSEWAPLWEEFASHATAGDLADLPRLPATGRGNHAASDSAVLQRLGREELAARAGRPVVIAPESFSALAERDPAAAWQSLAQHNRHDHATAALRALAGEDPAGTLRRFQAMPAATRKPFEDADESRRAAVWHTPLGSIFGAWARRDPRAAAAAVMELPPADRAEAANHLGMTWAFHDGPAAIRHILSFHSSGESFRSRHIRMDVMLRASFRTHPAETAKLVSESPVLRHAIGEAPCSYVALSGWAEADPEGVIDWLLESGSQDARLLERLGWVMRCTPATADRILRGLAAAGAEVDPRFVKDVLRHDPDLGRSLANDLGISLAEDPRWEQERIANQPAEACGRWLAALHQHGEPAAALDSLGWSGEMACELAARVARVAPDQAAELARLVPASSLDATNLWRRGTPDIARFWPELEPFLEYPESYYGSRPQFPWNRFSLDPAAAAEELLSRPLSESDTTQAVKLWALHDFPATAAWLARLPEGPARHHGELALAKIQAPYDPPAVMNFLTTHARPEDRTDELWSTCLRRVMLDGGDWQGWLARMPAGSAPRLRESLAAESRLLELARGSSTH